MRLSVIIPVRADPRVARCLDALAAQTLPPERFEVLVVDDGDGSARGPAERPGVRALTSTEGGSYAARARGVVAAGGEILVFTDADCVPPPTWLATIDALFADPACRVVVGPSSGLRPGPVEDWVQQVDEARWERLLRSDRVGYCDTRNLAIRRDVLESIGFDTAFRQAGDIELGTRLFRAGIPIRLEPSIRVAHDHPSTLLAVLRRSIRRGRGLARLDGKHGVDAAPTGQRAVRVLGVDVKRALLAAGRRPVLRWLVAAAAVAALLPAWAVLAVAARAPAAGPRVAPVFVAFDRLGLLLGRILG